MKRLLLMLCLSICTIGAMMAQRTITGTITGDDGESLIGANVIVKGTTIGTVTDFDGRYELEVPEDASIIVISYTGFTDEEVTLGAQKVIDMTLSEGILLDEAVVTALGISREKKTLGYATQEVGGEEFNRNQSTNFVNSLSGKASGVQIRQNNNMGGSTNVIIRGIASLSGNNQALYVIDGVPVDNANRNTNAQRAGSTGYDYGNAASDINPNDIESVNILKGAAATALYGSRALNGAVMITTKKGQKNKGIGVSFNSSFAVGSIDKSTFIKYQDEYGAGYGPYYNGSGNYNFRLLEIDVDGDGTLDPVVPTNEDGSYGADFDPNLNVYQWESFVPESDKFGKPYPYVAGENTPVDFFEKQKSWTNSVSFSAGNDKGSFRLGYTNVDLTGIMPNSSLKKHAINLGASYDLTDKLNVSFNANVFNNNAVGRSSTGYSDNLMSQFRQWWQTNVDIKRQEELYFASGGRNVTWNQVNPTGGDLTPQYWDNPYWSRYKNFQSDERTRVLGNVQLGYDVTSWMNVLGRVSLDSYQDLREERREVGSISAPFGVTRASESSGYQRYSLGFREMNTDLMVSLTPRISDNLSLKALLGVNVQKTRDDRVLSSTNGGLNVPGLFSLSNSIGALPKPVEAYLPKDKHGYYGSISLGFKDFLYLDVTNRYDISSALAADNRAYSYPSVAMGFVFSELLDSRALSFGKLRASYAEVGGDPNALQTNDVYTPLDNFNGATRFSLPNTRNNANLKPERAKSIEAGVELAFFGRRVGLDASYYKTNTTDQIFTVNTPSATGYSSALVNAGEIENKGFEFSLNLVPVRTKNIEWNTTINFSKNENLVVSLADGVDNFQIRSYQGGISLNATVGEPFGSIRGTGFQFDDNGNKVIGDNGYFIAVADQVIGNMNPDYLAGWNNQISFGNLSLNFLIDMQQGGEVYSLDLHYGQGTGLPDYTAGLNDLGNPKRNDLDDGGGLIFEGVKEDGTPNTTRVRADYFGGYYYWGNSSRNPGAMTIYDASYVKLREVGLSYKLPSNLFDNNFLQGITVSVVGNNVWIIDKKVPFADPEAGLSGGNDQNYLSGAYPTVRSIGVSLNAKF